MWHQAEHVALLVENSRNIARRSVGVFARRVTEEDAAFAFQTVESALIGEIIAFAMGKRKTHPLAFRILPREGGLRLFHHQPDRPASEFQIGIAHQRAWQKAS